MADVWEQYASPITGENPGYVSPYVYTPEPKSDVGWVRSDDSYYTPPLPASETQALAQTALNKAVLAGGLPVSTPGTTIGFTDFMGQWGSNLKERFSSLMGGNLLSFTPFYTAPTTSPTQNAGFSLGGLDSFKFLGFTGITAVIVLMLLLKRR